MLRGRAPQCNDGARIVPVIPALRTPAKFAALLGSGRGSPPCH
jgi:hypothetical protein